ncbi:cysteine desulfurase NifS [Tumebacillus algifaecis]|uniref:Cysteine desulfurase NifS n=1 Tax=Tumebacillus algifaecis TaxID=1214604 RepID=A0A223D309_9BACL|nr:cysteine desulfurase family protein [Tumebacillus algifaecis]ASS75970.1 cysteine desulfurase NifS [Tumebacillus algifaecis]
MKREIYLDNSATTKPYPEVIEAMVAMMESNYGNPSSLHKKGLLAEKEVDKARERLAKALAVKKSEIVFTSSGTEANHLALFGAAEQYASRGKHIITTGIEHPCVYDAAQELAARGWKVTFVGAGRDGLIDVDEVIAAWREDTVLVSVMYVNNETGALQPIREIGAFLKEKHKTLFHVDAVQALGKLPLKIKDAGIDLLAVSAHKIHGPKGVGALYVREGLKLTPMFYGGGQEKGLRSGTENVPGIVGFGVAVERTMREMPQAMAELKKLRDTIIEQIVAQIPNVRINTPQEAAPHVVNVSFEGVRGEVLVHALETHGVFVSTGSACSSKDKIYSRVLKVMGLPEKQLEGAVRISLDAATTREDVDALLAALKSSVEDLRLFSRR